MTRTSRRTALTLVAAAAATTAFSGAQAPAAASVSIIKAVAFDGFPILDPRSVIVVAKQLYPKNGEAFSSLFLTRLFEYQWLRALSGRYKNFLAIIDDAHLFAASQLGDDVTAEKRARLRDAFLELKAWPDVPSVLNALKAKGIKLAFLSNMTAAMLNAGLANSGLESALDLVLSTDAIKTYKPDPRAYRLGVDAFMLPKEQIAFVAFAGWDAAGAAWFGYPTIWINRLAAKPEELDEQHVVIGQGLQDVVRFLAERN